MGASFVLTASNSSKFAKKKELIIYVATITQSSYQNRYMQNANAIELNRSSSIRWARSFIHKQNSFTNKI